MNTSSLSQENTNRLLETLRVRFEKNMHRHPHLTWDGIKEKFLKNGELFRSIEQMEETGGEPDCIEMHEKVLVCDCARESPIGRRSLCYDQIALDERKEAKPRGSAMGMAQEMGISLLTEQHYTFLQDIEEFDTKTSSWIRTGDSIRKLGGALYGDRRYDHVFFYHNGASSYYAVRGFRGYREI